ncbi:MAG: CHAT domain-containing protein [Nostoc sp. SerVER01]|nr:CHAT domain-containing tetratricopeptide repeat protein [Nostoc sp. SerVER01]
MLRTNYQLILKLIPILASVLMAVLATVPFVSSQAIAQSQVTAKTKADEFLQQGLKHYQLSQFVPAIQSWQQALIVYRELKDRRGEGQTLGNLGLAYRATGEYSKAINYQQQALTIFQELKDRQSEGQLLGNLGNAYLAIGEYDKAIQSQQQSLTIARESKDRAGEGFVLGSLGIVFAELGNYPQAVESYVQSLAIARETKNREGEASTLNNLGAAYQAQNNNSKAVESYQQSLAIAQQIKNRSIEQTALSSLGVAYESLRNYPQAIEHQQQSLKIAQEIGDRRTEALGLNNLGHTLFLSGNLVEAENKLRLAVKVLDSLRKELDDGGKISIFDTQITTYNLLQQILVAQNKPEASLEASEQGRARAFVELMETKLKSKSASQIAPLTIAQIKQIAKQQKATLVEYSIVPDDFLHQGKLKAPELELLIWVVKPTGEVALQRVNLKSLREQKTSLKKIVINTRDAIDPATSSSINPEVVSKGLKQLHQLLIQPIADHLPQDPNARVIFIPQDFLLLVPFAALQDTTGKYLIEQHTIVSAPAIQVLDLTNQQRQRSQGVAKDILVVGNPTMPKIKVGNPPHELSQLPGAEQEANTIASLLQTKAITGDRATKLDILKQMPQARIVHLATHGLLDEVKQLGVPGAFAEGVSGAIALAPSGNDNGFLTPGEILNLKLNAELVVLSACQTGRGVITGDGVIGLSRSLLSAGAASAIVSLWEVPDDTTTTLMLEFYRNFQGETDKAQALRQAMLKTMQQSPDPTDWAGFTLIGEAD